MKNLFLLIVLFSVNFYSCSSINEISKKNTKVIIMPIMPRENYPFKYDQDRKILAWDFQSQGFNVVEDDSIWSKITEPGLDLTKLQNADIYRIASFINVDLIIANNGTKVFDCKKKTFIIDSNSYQRGRDLAMYLKSRGY